MEAQAGGALASLPAAVQAQLLQLKVRAVLGKGGFHLALLHTVFPQGQQQ
jgi:hypothetical protein